MHPLILTLTVDLCTLCLLLRTQVPSPHPPVACPRDDAVRVGPAPDHLGNGGAAGGEVNCQGHGLRIHQVKDPQLPFVAPTHKLPAVWRELHRLDNVFMCEGVKLCASDSIPDLCAV